MTPSDGVSDWLSTVANVLTIAAIIATAPWLLALRNLNTGTLMRRCRRRAASSQGPLRATRAAWARVDELRSGRRLSAVDEVDWLARTLRLPDSIPAGTGLPSGRLTALAAVYDEQARRLERGAVNNSRSNAALAEDAVRCRQTAAMLRRSAGGQAAALGSRPVAVVVPRRGLRLRLLAWPSRADEVSAFDLVCSWRRHRVIADTGPAHRAAYADGASTSVLPTSPAERARLEVLLSRVNRYDGALPRVQDLRLERDADRGHPRLHLGLAECSYSAVMLDHYPPGARSAAGDPTRRTEGRTGLLTLSLLPVSSDGDMLFVERSAHLVHGGAVGPAVQGNLELGSVGTQLGDLADGGYPDPVAAVVREALEETGLRIDRDRVDCLGLGQFSSEEERGTHVLLLSARLRESTDQVVASIRRASALAGSWEVADRLVAVRVPREPERVQRLHEWLLAEAALAPHASLCGIACLAALSTAPPSLVVHDEPPDVSDLVRVYPLNP